MEVDKLLDLKDEAIGKAMELTDDTDQQYWYQEGYCEAVANIESDARLKSVVSQWKKEEALWNEIFEAIRNALIEHQGEYITLELINRILGDDILYLRENNEAMEE